MLVVGVFVEKFLRLVESDTLHIGRETTPKAETGAHLKNFLDFVGLCIPELPNNLRCVAVKFFRRREMQYISKNVNTSLLPIPGYLAFTAGILETLYIVDTSIKMH